MANKNSMWLGVVAVAFIMIFSFIAYMVMIEPVEQVSTNEKEYLQNEQTLPDSNDTDVSGVSTIQFTDKGFSEPTYTVRAAEIVTVINDSSGRLEFSSDSHPTHRAEPSLNTPIIGPGETITFKAPSQAGEYGFHDHLDARHIGTLIVTE